MRLSLNLSLVVALALISSTASAQAPPTEPKPKASPSATKPSEVKPSATKPSATTPAEAKPSTTKSTDVKPTEPKPSATKAAAPKPSATKPMEAKPADSKPSETKPSESKPKEDKPKQVPPKVVKPSEAKPAESKPDVPKPTEAQIQAAKANPFDGQSLYAWTTTSGKPVTGWIAKDGVITLPRGVKGGNIVTADEFGSFSLAFEWKIEKGGNSGIKYRVRNYDGKGALGIEYQIYDDPKDGPAKGSTASIYNIYAPNAKRKPKPIGEFNTAKIVVRGNYIEHWLNGEMVASAVIGSADWMKHVAESKFDDVKDFALNPRGKIMLTDHSTEVTFRNMKFEVLPEPQPAVRVQQRRRGLIRNLLGK